MTSAGKAGAWLAGLGALLAAGSTLLGASQALLAVPFALWAAAPWAALWALSRGSRQLWPVLGAGLAGLSAEAGVRAMVFLWPQGSTSAVALVFSPGFILALVMPAGAAVGWLAGSVWEKGGAALRAAVVLACAAALGLEFVALAKPELFPTNVARRRRLQEAVGAPRVVTPGRFELVLVSSASAWHQVVELDGKPGDELAVVDHRGARFLDVESFAQTGFAPFPGEPGRLWSWMTQLVPMEDGLAAVQTGGGFSETKVQALDGTLLWAYKPDERLNPAALVPADLEGDRDFEFYAVSGEKLARLALSGREVWARPARNASLLGVLPRTERDPAWVAALEYGRRAAVWDERGRPLGERAVTAKDSPFALVDAPQGRAFLHRGGNSARGYALDGRLLFDVPLGEFALVQAVGLTLKGGPALALLGAAPKDVRRWRLLIVDGAGQALYDEILAAPPVLRAAQRPDGTTLLLLSRDGLRALRPR